MAAANSTLTPPEPMSGLESGERTPAKRKREDDEDVSIRGLQEVSARSLQMQQDMLEILQQHDTTPSFLRHAIEKQDKQERSPKKVRLSDGENTGPSISSKLSTGAYSTLSDLRKDADHVSESLVSSIREAAKERESSRPQVDDLKQIQRIQAFHQVIKDVVEQESRYKDVHGSKVIKEEDTIVVNGAVPKKEDAISGRAGTVLTLFGNAPTPKQLFSSMQRPSHDVSDRIIKTELPVEEMSLPTGLAATKIMPIPADQRKKGPTFEDAFAPPSSLPQLQPPKAHKRSTTRDNTTINWEFKDQTSRSKKGGYTTQSVSVGDWLGYGGVESKDEPASPREKRKQRDRALSGGESTQPPPSRESLADARAKEEEALFRRAYSSFAPSHDNSTSIVPHETKSMVWWNKVGERKYNETFAIDPALLDESSQDFSDLLPGMEEVELNDEEFGKIIEELGNLPENEADQSTKPDMTNVDQVLSRVSELLETLASHQRIRNATLGSSAAASRTPISPAPALKSRIGRPDSPAEDEVATYESLRHELAYLILRLPPYAVAKLDGDQLAELGVSTLIPFEGNDIKGTMEEDQVARLAKYNAMATAAGIATLTRPGSQQGQHYSSTNSRTPAIGQAANTRYGQSTQFGASRTPMQPAFQRSTSNQSTYGTPSATAPRPGFGQQPNQYTRPQGYNQPNGQQQYYRPQQTPGGYGGYNQQYSSTPQQQPRPGYSSQPLAQYQQRAVNAASYQSNTQPQSQQNQTPFTQRTASPLKPAPTAYPPQPSPGPTQRPRYPQQAQPGSGRTTPANNYPSQPQTPVNGYGQRPVAPAPRTGSGTPQPIQPAPMQQQQQQQQQQQVPAQTNGHASNTTPSKSMESMMPAPFATRASGRFANRQCNLCGQAFRQPGLLARHMRWHTGERPFACTYPGCTKTFVVRITLRRHVVSHTGEKTFACTVDGCKKWYLREEGLKRHEKRHFGGLVQGVWSDSEDEDDEDDEDEAGNGGGQAIAPSPGILSNSNSGLYCNVCAQYLLTKDKYDLHMLMHVDEREKPFICTDEGCDMRFKRQAHLNDHMRSHSDDRPFVCSSPNCRKSYKAQASLNRHRMEQHRSDTSGV